MIKEKLRDKQARALTVIETLQQLYPDVECTLDYRDDPFRLMVGAILAAQCTDARVNQVTPGLFSEYPQVQDFASATPEDIEPYIRSCGLFRMKARHIQAAAKHLQNFHKGMVPEKESDLLSIPGVGRKIANLILGDSFGRQAVVVDTHCMRVSALLGFTDSKNPVQVEKDLMQVLPQENWTQWGHLMVAHGRELCIARRPRCRNCSLSPHCPGATSSEVEG